MAAAQAVLDVIRDEDLLANAELRGRQLMDGMRNSLHQSGHPCDVRGAGLYIGVEFVTGDVSKSPDTSTANAVVNGLRRRRVLVSCAGPYANVLKVRPPLVFSESDVDRYLTEFDTVVRDVAVQ